MQILIHHARTLGGLMRPDNPLLPNYAWVPIGHHGRASSVGINGRVKRLQGQTRSQSGTPYLGPSKRLDYELEQGACGRPRVACSLNWTAPYLPSGSTRSSPPV